MGPTPLPLLPPPASYLAIASMADASCCRTQTQPSLPAPLPPDSQLGRDLTPSEVKVEKVSKVRGKTCVKYVTMYQPPNLQPKLFDRSVEVMQGPRHSRRPSAVARKAGKRNVTEVSWADEYDQPEEGWSDEELMPAETTPEDYRWAAGPIDRELPLPPFRGPSPGPTDVALNKNSTPLDIMQHLVPHEFKLRWCSYTKQHARAWRAERPNWKKDTVERSMLRMQIVLRPRHFDLWRKSFLCIERPS